MKAELEKTLQFDDEQLQARMALALLLLQQGDLDSAEQHLAVLKRKTPGNPDMLLLEGNLAKLSGKHDIAVNIFSKVFEVHPSTKTLLALTQERWDMGDHDEAMTLLGQWIQDNNDDIEARLALANYYLAEEKVDDALGQYHAVIERDKNNLVALNNLAWYLRNSDARQALKYAEQAETIAPDSAKVKDTLALVLLKNGDVSRAVRKNDQAYAMLPGDPTILFHRAMILEQAGQIDEAKKALSDVLDSGINFKERNKAEAMRARLQGG